MTNDAATENVPDRVEGQISSSDFQLQWNSQLRHVSQEMFVSGTHQMHFCARIHDNGQMLGMITCIEHRKFCNEPHNQRTWQESRVSSLGQIQKPGDKTSLEIAARATTFSEFALLFTGTDRPGGATSDDDETGVKSTHFAQKKTPPDTISPNVADS